LMRTGQGISYFCSNILGQFGFPAQRIYHRLFLFRVAGSCCLMGVDPMPCFLRCQEPSQNPSGV
jgi:hypothetical protein